MKKVYLDNASTTPMYDEVIQEVTKSLAENFGNPSSTHSFGRNAKNLLELSRKSIAKIIQTTSQEIVFTSGGTEGNNLILRSVLRDLGVKRIISSKIEHQAVLLAIKSLQKEYDFQVQYVNITPQGHIDYGHLVELLQTDQTKTLVSLMHVNNEIGNILDLEKVGRICSQYSALFHSDMVQSIGKTEINIQNLAVDFVSASAHKFHGPKGVGFIYVKKSLGLKSILFGGEQERGLRPGTEAVHQIIGMTKALELVSQNLSSDREIVLDLKKYLFSKLAKAFPLYSINGDSDGIQTIANVLLPLAPEKASMILFHLDMKGIAVSRGSACQSGSTRPSHVLAEILSEDDLKKPSLRISLSSFNTIEDIDLFIDALKTLK